MKSYLKMGVEFLVAAFQKLLELLKTGFILLSKNKRLCKKIIFALLFVLVWTLGVRYGASHTKVEPEIVYVQQDSTQEDSEQTIYRSNREQNVNDIAKVLYGYRYNTDRDLEGIVWVILNRVDNKAEFHDFTTIDSVVNQPSQWMGYSKDNPVLENLWDIADDVLYRYETDGKRLFGKEYLYFEWRSDYIVFKTELYDSRTCQKWRSY